MTLAKGGNVSLSRQAAELTAVRVGIGWQVRPGGSAQGADASALLCDAGGKVLSEDHFVFFNNPRSPCGSVRLLDPVASSGRAAAEDRQQIEVDLTALAPEVEKIVFPLSLDADGPEGGSRTFAGLGAVHIQVHDADGGVRLARYDLGAHASSETAMVLGEIYRRGAEWKFRATGQGYASGLAGIAQDFGVDVLADPAPPSATATAQTAVEDAAKGASSAASPGGPAPSGDPAPPAGAGPLPGGPPPAGGAPGGPFSGPSVPPAPAPAAPPPYPTEAPLPSYSKDPSGSPYVTCFFDPDHGPGTTPVMWSPQWGVPRQIHSCGSCAQRVQTTPPPFYTPAQPGYPQQGYAQAGYPAQGYPQGGYAQPGYAQPGYAQPGYPAQPYGDPYHGEHHHGGHHYGEHHGDGGQRRFGMGAVVGAGAAGLVGGALLNEALDDDEPDVVVNEFDGDGDGDFF